MPEPAVGGDLVVSARPATPEAFEPYGRLLYAGDRARIGGGGRILVALDPKEAGPRRVRHLQRYPESDRMVLALGDASILLVVAGRGERPGGPAAAFRIPGGVGVLVNAGVWHAGPVPLADATLLELLEVKGSADHLDRRTVADLFGAEGLRILLPDEPGAPGPGLDLADEFSVTVATPLKGSLILGCLAFDRISVSESGASLREEADRLTEELRRQWGSDVEPRDIPGLEPVRVVYRALGIDPTKTRPSSEALLRRVLQGKPLYRINNLVDALNLCSLRMLIPFGAYDRGQIAAPIVLRVGAQGEAYDGLGSGRVRVEGRPVLADREGAFGNPTADSLRTRVTLGTSRALVVLYLPATLDAAGIAAFLDRVSATVVRHCGGEETGRRIVA